MTALAIVPATLMIVACGVAGTAAPAGAQGVPPLADLHSRAAALDPRTRQAALHRAQSELREASIASDRRPAFIVEGVAQYQSDVVTLPVSGPGGPPIASPPHDTYDLRISARQRLLDPSLEPRRGVERAQLAELESRVATSIFPMRQAVNEAYFAALLLQWQERELALALTDLESLLRLARERVAAGTALPSEADALEAELLRRRQGVSALAASRTASLGVLAALTGVTVAPGDTLHAPDLGAAVARIRTQLDTTGARPEYVRFARARDLLTAQSALVTAGELPRVSAFGRLGHGRPGLNMLSTRFDTYWITGVQLEWTPFTWGTARRERDVLALQRQVVDADEAAFRATLERSTIHDLAAIDRLGQLLADDERIIVLRERILREARVRFAEHAITAAEYVDRQTDVTQARVVRATHRAELARAQARLLTTLGLEVR